MTGRLSHRDLTILGAVLVLGIAAALWWLLVSPARSDSAERGEQLAAVEREINGINDTLDRLRAAEPGAARRTAQRLRLAKALPAGADTAGAILQLQRAADLAGVELTTITVGAIAPQGAVTAHELAVIVTGRFHDVDDFLYRVHALVSVNAAGNPSIEGRLIAVRDIKLTPVQGKDTTTLGSGERLTAELTVLAYSAPADGSPAAVSAPVTAPATASAGAAAPSTATAPATTSAPGAATTAPSAPTSPGAAPAAGDTADGSGRP